MANDVKSKDFKTKNRSNKRKSSKSRNSKTDFKDLVTKEIGSDNFRKPSGYNTFNDPDWYIYDDVMFDGVISMPTLEFKGVKTKWATSRAIPAVQEGFLEVPTLSVLYMNPSAGYVNSDWSNSPINIIARKMYAELSASNAKTSQYAPQDIATLILALGQVIAITHHVKRMYGIFNYYNFYNRAVPKALFGAIGSRNAEEMSTMMSMMPEIRARLNKIIARLDSIHFPGSINYFRKCEYIYSNLFVDRDDEMPTYLAMMPYSTWIIDETTSEEGTILKTYNVPNAINKVANPMISYIFALDDMLEQILTSATFNYIFADLINLANRNVISSDWIKVDMVPIDYTIEPLYSEQFNWQFMNATILGSPKEEIGGLEDTPLNDVYPSVMDNSIRYAPTFTGKQSDILRMGKPNPVRIPSTTLSDKDFVDLLAYYNIPTVLWSMDDPSITDEVKVPGLSDYYAVGMYTFTGNEVFTNIEKFYTSNGPSYNDTESIGTIITTVCKILNIVHAPLMTLPNVDFSQDKTYILSKLGTFVIPDTRAIVNLRDEVFFGLFKIK